MPKKVLAANRSSRRMNTHFILTHLSEVPTLKLLNHFLPVRMAAIPYMERVTTTLQISSVQ